LRCTLRRTVIARGSRSLAAVLAFIAEVYEHLQMLFSQLLFSG